MVCKILSDHFQENQDILDIKSIINTYTKKGDPLQGHLLILKFKGN